MPATRQSTEKSSAKRASEDGDALAKLKADHQSVQKMFDRYEKEKDEMSDEDKEDLVDTICGELVVHAQIEEEIFYPAVKAALKDKLLVPEATVEHGSVKDLIAQLEGVEPDGEMYDAKVKVLAEYVKHHVKEEQNEMFPKAKAASLDMAELGARMAARKEDLLAQSS